MSREKGHDEVFCASCGEAIKKEAEICPSCGVRNQEASQSKSSSTTRKSRSRTPIESNSSDTIQYGLLALQWGFGALLILAGLGALVSGAGFIGWVISAIQGLIFIAIGAVLLPLVREKLEFEHSMSTFGRIRSVNQESLQQTTEPCTVCYDSIERGVARVYQEQFVLFGVPVYVFEEGRNAYCRSCAGGEPEVDSEKLDITIS